MATDRKKSGRAARPGLTMDDIARLAGVSKPTVSRVLSNSPLVTEETKQRVRDVAAAHGYAINRNAQRLRAQRSNTIAVVIDFSSLPGRRLSQPFHFELIAEVTNALSVRNLDLLLQTRQADDPRLYQAMLSSKDVDGILFLGQGAREPVFRALAKTDAPFVVWGAVDPASPYCTVGSDNFGGGALAGRRFAELDRKRVVFVGRRDHRELDLRRQGLEHGLRAAGSDATIVDVEPADLSYEASHAAVRALLDRPGPAPDAVFGAGDTIAMAAVAALREVGLAVPDQVSVIGYDDIPQAAHCFPPLTTIRQDARLAGALLVEKLMQKIDGAPAASAMLPTEILVRQT